jgi:hypothetical protein
MKTSGVRFVAVVLVALGASAVVVPPAPAAAQQGPGRVTQTIESDYLFNGPLSMDMPPGADRGTTWLVDFVKRAQQAQPPGSQCPIDVDFTVTWGPNLKELQDRSYDPLLGEALALARRDVIARILNGFGPSVRVTPNVTKGIVNTVTIGAQKALDREKPTLRTTSDPRKGSKVKPGDEIVVTMVARDDANRWQSGIKSVTLVATSDGDALIAGPTYPPRPSGCNDVPREREVRATYRVPADPPPIVRLVATAVDHVGLTDVDIGEFPTGDFYGTLNYSGGQTPHQHVMRADFVLNHDGRGNLAGAMVGETRFIDASTAPGCFTTMIRPHRFRVALTGAFTEARAIKAFIGDIEDTPMVLNNRCPTYNATDQVTQLGFRNYIGLGWQPQQPFLGTPSPLGDGELRPDGTRVYRWQGAANMSITVTLRRSN